VQERQQCPGTVLVESDGALDRLPLRSGKRAGHRCRSCAVVHPPLLFGNL